MGFNPIGNIMSNPLNVASLAMGPAGWASIAARSLMSQIGQQVIQRLGTSIGLPQPAIDMAQASFAGSMGDSFSASMNMREAVSGFAQGMGASAADEGAVSREMDDAINDIVSRMAEGDDAKAARAGGRSGGTGGQSWLMALAEALGKKLDKMAREMSSMADQITDKTPSLTAKFGAKTQEFSILMNATTNGIKTIGEGLANSARKG